MQAEKWPCLSSCQRGLKAIIGMKILQWATKARGSNQIFDKKRDSLATGAITSLAYKGARKSQPRGIRCKACGTWSVLFKKLEQNLLKTCG